MKKILSTIIFLTCTFLTSCSDFTDTTPKGMVIPTTTSDYKGMLIDVTASSVAYPLANVCSDNVFSKDLPAGSSTWNAYYWLENFFKDNERDEAWNATYSKIYTMNVVIQNMMGSTEGTEAEKKALLAEAKLWRAYYYWYLQSLYAPAYDAKTANTDLSVPLVQVPDLEAKSSRATVKEVTDAIWADLADAENQLPEKASNDYRPSKAAVYALKARIYLYQCDYDKAGEQADLALAQNSTLNDMKTWKYKNELKPYGGITNKPTTYLSSPEKIWFQSTSFNSLISMFCISNELQTLYGSTKDLRFKFWFTNRDRRGNLWEDGYYRYLQELDYSFTVPEMMLIKAEALARNKETKCLEILNNLRTMRFSSEDYTPLTASSGKDLLSIVLDERQRELSLSGLRWLDMKRLSKEGLYTTTLVRSENGTDHKLEPNSKLYVFPIPGQVLSINSNVVPNDRKQ
jgi:hypothetical protein